MFWLSIGNGRADRTNETKKPKLYTDSEARGLKQLEEYKKCKNLCNAENK